MMANYPEWICGPCGRAHGDERPLLATYHDGDCGWCGGEGIPVTHPRDYGYPDAPKVRRGRGPGKKPAMRHITIRIPQHVVAHYDGDTRAMRDAWVAHVEELIRAGAST